MSSLFNDWKTEAPQDDFKCSCCGGSRYKLINITTTKSRYKTVTKASGLKTVSKVARIDIEVSKDFAECLSCRYRKLLDETETVIPKETKKEAKERLAAAKFDGHFLNPGSSQ